jgi:hypothetical protein
MWFQILLILAMVAIAIFLLRATPSPRHLAIRRVLVLLVLAAAVVVVVWPGTLTWLAHLVGIGRGSDLLFYAAIVAGLFYISVDYKRSLEAERATTRLARQLTLAEARLEDAIRDGQAQRKAAD